MKRADKRRFRLVESVVKSRQEMSGRLGQVTCPVMLLAIGVFADGAADVRWLIPPPDAARELPGKGHAWVVGRGLEESRAK